MSNGYIYSSVLPTVFARNLAIGVDLLLVEPDDSYDQEDIYTQEQRLIVFQQISAAGTLDDALTAYLGVKIDDRQMEILALIHKSTKPWLLGHSYGALLEKMKSAKPSELPDLVNTILENFGSKAVPDQDKQKGLLVRFAQIPENASPTPIVEKDDELDQD